ncbi:MAG: hypothetical protein V7636_1653 [Actinomycetota bacterium]
MAYRLERRGYHVYLPSFAPHARVDLVALRDAVTLRIQVKSARVIGGAVVFRVCSNTGNIPRDYRGEVDAFGVYSPDLDRVYLVPVEHTATRACSLRLEPARSGQQKGIRLASDYELRPPG